MDQRVVEKALATTDFIASHAVADNPKPMSDDVFSSAHGDLIFGKIATALGSSPTNVKLQALENINDLVRKDENIVRAIDEGVFTQLIIVFTNSDAGCRRLSSQAIIHITRAKVGRDHTISEGTIPNIAKLTSDADDAVRGNGYQILMNLMEERKGLAGVIRNGLPKTFINYVKEEKNDSIKCAALKTICRCIADSEGYHDAMDAGVVNVLTTALAETSSPKVQAAACMCFNVVAMNRDGKDECVAAGAVPEIVALLPSDTQDVRVQASCSILHITNALSGKEAALEAGALEHLVNNARDPIDIVVANSMQAIANLAEHPDARHSELLKRPATMALLEDLRKSKSELVRRGVENSLAKIKWEP